jgi:membrane protein DedA with SNARE-associated domain
MHHVTLEHLTAIHLFLLLLQYGYFLLFPIAVIEGPIAAIVAGALVASGALNLYVVILVLVFADLVGDLLYYSLGRWGHVRFLENLIEKIGITNERLEPLTHNFKKNSRKLLLIGKTQGLGSIILYFAGVAKMPLPRFIGWNLVGTLPKVIIFVTVGYFFGQSLIQSQHAIDYFTLSSFGIALVLIVFYFAAKWFLETKIGSYKDSES